MNLRLTWGARPLLAALCLLALPAGAEPGKASGLYQVEVIIFTNRAGNPDEDLGRPAEGRNFNGVFDSNDPPPKVVKILDVSQMQLGGIAAKMQSSGSYQVLAHAGWIQSATGWNRHAGLPLDQVGIAVPGLNGNLYLERGQLLHFGVNLTYGTDPVNTLAELRLIKLNDKNYFDHPVFGVIAMVTPASAAAAAATPDQQ
jgi:Peptidoglycan-binding protein, CsiV